MLQSELQQLSLQEEIAIIFRNHHLHENVISFLLQNLQIQEMNLIKLLDQNKLVMAMEEKLYTYPICQSSYFIIKDLGFNTIFKKLIETHYFNKDIKEGKKNGK